MIKFEWSDLMPGFEIDSPTTNRIKLLCAAFEMYVDKHGNICHIKTTYSDEDILRAFTQYHSKLSTGYDDTAQKVITDLQLSYCELNIFFPEIGYEKNHAQKVIESLARISQRITDGEIVID